MWRGCHQEGTLLNLGQSVQAWGAFALSQTMDQVTAGKEIEYFKDMKVAFVNGKVTDVQ